MFQSAISPIRDTKGNDTVNVVSTPYFPESPLPAAAAKTKLCLRLFEDSSNDWTTDSCPDGCRCQVCHYADLYGHDSPLNVLTIDSSSNGAFRESCPDGCRCQVCHYADLYGHDSSSNDWTADSEADTEETEIPFQWSATP